MADEVKQTTTLSKALSRRKLLATGAALAAAGAVGATGVGLRPEAAHARVGRGVSGGGEAVAAPAIYYVGHDKVVRGVPSIEAIGNRITFAFEVTVDIDGIVRGEQQLVDHALNLVVYSDVVSLSIPHAVLNSAVGAKGLTAVYSSSTQGVFVNGERKPGWRFANSPIFDGSDGVGDTVCFELFDDKGTRLRQWSGFVSSGDVQIVK